MCAVRCVLCAVCCVLRAVCRRAPGGEIPSSYRHVCCVLGPGPWALGPVCCVLFAGCWVLGAGCWVLGAGPVYCICVLHGGVPSMYVWCVTQAALLYLRAHAWYPCMLGTPLSLCGLLKCGVTQAVPLYCPVTTALTTAVTTLTTALTPLSTAPPTDPTTALTTAQQQQAQVGDGFVPLMSAGALTSTSFPPVLRFRFRRRCCIVPVHIYIALLNKK